MAKDGRYEKTVRLRLNLNDDNEAGMFDWLQSLKPMRGMKAALKLGVELAHAAKTHDYERLAVLLPGFVQYIEARVQSPANQAFANAVQNAALPEPKPVEAKAPVPVIEEPEPVMIEEPDFAGFEF
jgi:hypothetical protein